MKVKNLHMYTFVLMIITLFVFLPSVSAQDTTVGESFGNTVQSFVIDILEVAVPLIVTALLTYGLQFIRKQVEVVKTRLSSEHLYLVESIVAIAVKNAEQQGLIGALSTAGTAKKAYAIEFVQKALRERGLTLLADNVVEISGLIESAVNDGIHKNWKDLSQQS